MREEKAEGEKRKKIQRSRQGVIENNNFIPLKFVIVNVIPKRYTPLI